LVEELAEESVEELAGESVVVLEQVEPLERDTLVLEELVVVWGLERVPLGETGELGGKVGESGIGENQDKVEESETLVLKQGQSYPTSLP
jgi:hypothetical protein